MNFWVRLRFLMYVLLDRWFGTHLVDREMGRLQATMDRFEGQASVLQRQMGDLNHLLHVIQVQMCVLYLRQRHSLRPEGWLRFDPRESEEEEHGVDLLINRLVRHNLATVQTEVVGPREYVYQLRPRWAAIVELLSAQEGLLDSWTASWIDGIRSSE